MSFIEAMRRSLRREVSWLKASFWHWGMVSVLPLFFSLLIWAIFIPAVPRNLPIGVLDLDHTALSRQIERYLTASPGVHVAERYAASSDAEKALRRGTVYAVLVIPKDTTAKIKKGQYATLVLHHNAQFGTHSPLIQKEVRSVVGTLSAGIEINILTKKAGRTPKVAGDSFTPLQNIIVNEFNLIPNYQVYLATTFIPSILFIVILMTGTYIFGRELREKTLPEWLPFFRRHAPVFYPALLGAIIGKLLPSFLAFAALGAIIFLLFYQIMTASLPAFAVIYLAFLLFTLLSLVIGAYFTLFSLSLRKGLASCGFFSAPAFVFSGIGFPLAAMPKLAYVWAHFIPLTYYLDIQIRQLQLHAPVAPTLFVMLGFGTAIVGGLMMMDVLIIRAFNRPEKWGLR